jgi:tetratricopeptide (TPR) repeat protein
MPFIPPHAIHRAQNPEGRRQRHLAMALVASLWFAALAACTATPPSRPALPDPTPRQVSWSGGRLRLDDADAAVFPSEYLLTRSQTLVDAKLTQGIDPLVRLYPDLALESLRSADENAGSRPVLGVLAAAYDRWERSAASPPPVAEVPASPAAWSLVFRIRREHPEKLRGFDQAQATVRQLLENGRFKAAAQVRPATLVDDPELACLKAEALRLEGVALLLDNQPAAATARFQEATALLGTNHPHAAAELGLLSAEALRRADQRAAAAAAWLPAAQSAISLGDPVLLERAIATRLAESVWPAPLATSADAPAPGASGAASTQPRLDGGRQIPFAQDGLVGLSIADRRLARGEFQAALLAYARAGSLSEMPTLQARCKLGQARALAALGQTPSATVLLFDLVAQSDPSIAKPAMALLGSLRVQEGQTPQGARLLRRALDDNPTVRWPNRADAEADLGLVCLLTDQEGDGLGWLHQAQAHFEEERRWESLVRSFVNESAYFREKGDADRADQLAAKASQTARAVGFVLAPRPMP